MIPSCNVIVDENGIGGIQEIPPSFINLDILLPVSALEYGVNRLIKDNLVNSGFPLNKKGDSLFLEIERLRKFNFSYESGQLNLTAPIAVTASVNKTILGFQVVDRSKKLTFNAIAKLTSQISLNENWDLEFDCDWKGFVWEEEPLIKVLGFNINLRNFIENEIEQFEKKIEEIICETISNKVNFKKSIGRVYENLQNSHQITQSPIPLFFKAKAQSIKGKMKKGRGDTLQFQLEFQSELFVTTSTNEKTNRKLKLPDRMDPISKKTGLSAFIGINIPFTEIQEILGELLINKEFKYQSYETIIHSISVEPLGNKVKLILEFTGDLNGKITIAGVPELNDDFIFSLASLAYSLDDVDDWIQITDYAVGAAIETYLEQVIRFDLSSFFKNLDKKIEEGINNSKASEKIDVSLFFENFKLYSRGMDKNQIQFIFHTDGNARLILNERVFKKSVKP